MPATLHLSSAYYFANTCVHPPQRQNAAIDRRCNPYFILTEGRPDLALANMADSGAPPTRSDAAAVADVDMPKVLPSEKGIDYIPLATMLATGQLAEADQVRCVGEILLLLLQDAFR